MIDDEHDGGIGIDRAQRLVVHVAEPHAIQQGGQQARGPGSELEIGVGAEVRHDLAGIGLDARHRQCARLAGGGAMRFRGAHQLRVEHEAVDQALPARELERLDAQLQPAVELGDRLVEPPPQEPTHARDQQTIEQADQRQRRKNADEPDRQFNRSRHHALRA